MTPLLFSIIATASAADVIARLPATLTVGTWDVTDFQPVTAVTLSPEGDTLVETADGYLHTLPDQHPLHGEPTQVILNHYSDFTGNLFAANALVQSYSDMAGYNVSAPLLDDQAFVDSLIGATTGGGDGRTTLVMDLAIVQLNAADLLLDVSAITDCLQTEPDNMIACVQTEPDEMIVCAPAEAGDPIWASALITEAEWEAAAHEVISPRDAASGLPTGFAAPAVQSTIDAWSQGLFDGTEMGLDCAQLLNTVVDYPGCPTAGLFTDVQWPY